MGYEHAGRVGCHDGEGGPVKLAELLRNLPDTATVPVGWLREQLALGGAEAPPPAEDLLTADEAARRLGVSKDWLYRQTKRLPFARKLSRKVVRYSAAGLAKYLEGRDRVA